MDVQSQSSAKGIGTASSRDGLLSRHIGLVYHVARQVTRSRHLPLELEELVSAGTLGLMEAAEHFDASRGLAFSTFAAPRIRGAMLDELRRQDTVPRSQRRRARTMQQAAEGLRRSLGREPSPAETAAALGVDVATVWRWQADEEATRTVPLDALQGQHGESRHSPMEALIGANEPDLDELLSREQQIVRVRGELVNMAEQERTVLTLYYFEELKLSDIARILGVSESRISQIRGRAVARLRAALSAECVSGLTPRYASSRSRRRTSGNVGRRIS